MTKCISYKFMIDTHAHLDFENFDDDREEVIRRAFDSGVKNIINIGVDLETSKRSIELAEKYENIFASVGFHPHDAKEILNSAGEDGFVKLKNLAQHKKVVAIGEIGLDYSKFKEAHQVERQKELLARQLNIADELDLPVVIHCREAWEDLFEIIARSKSKVPGIQLHCFSGDQRLTEKFLDIQNVSFSFSGNITYPKPVDRANNFVEVIKIIPLDRLMLDSDCPFLSPQAMRGKRNEPVNIRFIAEKIAEIKEISVDSVEEATDETAEKFFGIKR